MTPLDNLVVFKRKPHSSDEADEIHISVTFTADLPLVEKLEKRWECVAPVKIGGPALDDFGGEFIPGKYISEGNVITHRGCPNNCWFCDVWKREGRVVRELPIQEGWNLLDNNIFACSLSHQQKVFEMLLRQKRKPRLSGGLEAARFTSWQAEWLLKLKLDYCYFAYDTPDDLEPLAQASKLLSEYGLFKGHSIGVYVLIGYKKDTFELAEKRLIASMKLGFMPQAMLYNRADFMEEYDMLQWRRFQREWANKVIVGSKMSKLKNGESNA
jgi:hypothetical protein